jgi:Domain of unknown function (DUF4349)
VKKSYWIGVGAAALAIVFVTGSLIMMDRASRARVDQPRYADSNLMVAPPREYGLIPPATDAQLPPPPAAIISPVARADLPGGGIGVSAAPGVAFSYSYAFRLPNANIAGVQEAHAAACEKLGLDRCRITGMRYTVSDQDDVHAMLALKLAPDLARQFGKDGIAAIQKAQGSLVDAAISGNDAGSAIDQSRRRTASIEARIKSLEAQLKPGTARRYDDSNEIRNHIATLQTELDRESQSRTDAGEALANTPMVFQYNSGNALSTSALGEAWATSTSGFVAIIGLFVIAIGVLLPWLLLSGAGWLLYRRFLRPNAPATGTTEPTP